MDERVCQHVSSSTKPDTVRTASAAATVLRSVPTAAAVRTAARVLRRATSGNSTADRVLRHQPAAACVLRDNHNASAYRASLPHKLPAPALPAFEPHFHCGGADSATGTRSLLHVALKVHATAHGHGAQRFQPAVSDCAAQRQSAFRPLRRPKHHVSFDERDRSSAHLSRLQSGNKLQHKDRSRQQLSKQQRDTALRLWQWTIFRLNGGSSLRTFSITFLQLLQVALILCIKYVFPFSSMPCFFANK